MRAGQDPARFADYSHREMVIIIEAARLRDGDLAYDQARLASFAYHDPRNIPRPSDGSPSQANAEADGVYVRATLKAMAMQSRGDT